jgi:hypothetical protein
MQETQTVASVLLLTRESAEHQTGVLKKGDGPVVARVVR